MTRPLHLLSVWNPAYSGDALDVHLALLLEWGRRAGGMRSGRRNLTKPRLLLVRA